MNRILVLGDWLHRLTQHASASARWLRGGYEVVVLDNLCNSSPESLKWLSKLAGSIYF